MESMSEHRHRPRLLIWSAMLLGIVTTSGVFAKTVTTPDLASYVNPFNGTRAGASNFGTGGGAGNTFPGPVVPFGMIQFGPDTSPSILNVGGGYSYDDMKIRGFSL